MNRNTAGRSTIALALMTGCAQVAVAEPPWVPTALELATAAQPTAPLSARTWTGREAEIEAFLMTAEILGLDDIPVGVTNPKSASLAPGGPVDRFAWKPLTPGIRNGFYESYKAEIAAYELDRLLGLGMVPVTVERRIRGERGAAVMWVTPTRSFRDLGGTPRPPTRHLGYWTIQLIRAKMFDNLIYNQDPNEGNWLVDPAWNLVLIDHSRSFTPDTRMAHGDMNRVDRDLWTRMQQLDEPGLRAALGDWLSDREIRAVLERRDRMAEVIDELVTKHGAGAVLLHYAGRPGTTPPLPGRDSLTAPLGDDLVARLLAAADDAPVIVPRSEVGWMGTVVEFDRYRCPDAEVTEADRHEGCALGLLSGHQTLCLSGWARDLEPYERLPGLVGRDVEILGVLTDHADMPVVQVTMSRVR